MLEVNYHPHSTSHLASQKADGTCNTNFKKTQALEQVTKVLEDFVNGDLGILVSRTPESYDVARDSHHLLLLLSLASSSWAVPGWADPGQLCSQSAISWWLG